MDAGGPLLVGRCKSCGGKVFEIGQGCTSFFACSRCGTFDMANAQAVLWAARALGGPFFFVFKATMRWLERRKLRQWGSPWS